jgi:hypothetical protein
MTLAQRMPPPEKGPQKAHENGAYGTLSAVCMGVESLPA